MRFIAFLRAINVGGHTVTMQRLKTLFEALGFSSVETFIASGNVIFSTRAKDVAALQRKIEGHLLKSLGYEVKTFLRTDAEVAAIARYQPFPAAQLKAAGALSVGFLAEPLEPATKKVLLALTSDSDAFHVHDRELYWLCKGKQSDSEFSNVRFEKILRTRATFRNVNTVVRLAAKYPPATRA
jgi:uncharacterized protein (DUF1697 family)